MFIMFLIELGMKITEKKNIYNHLSQPSIVSISLTYIHTYIHTYMQTYIQTYIHSLIKRTWHGGGGQTEGAELHTHVVCWGDKKENVMSLIYI